MLDWGACAVERSLVAGQLFGAASWLASRIQF